MVNVDYPSREKTVQALANSVIPEALKVCPESGRVNFVTHSMGGILVRVYLADHALARLGRVVMLAPPNQGSQVVDKLKDVPGFQFINGPAGSQLGTDDDSVPLSLGKVDFELGVVAGTKSINLLLSTMLPNPDDGKVSVESTKVKGMKDHITMPVTHPFLMKNPDVIAQTLYFLHFGKFNRSL